MKFATFILLGGRIVGIDEEGNVYAPAAVDRVNAPWFGDVFQPQLNCNEWSRLVDGKVIRLCEDMELFTDKELVSMVETLEPERG